VKFQAEYRDADPAEVSMIAANAAAHAAVAAVLVADGVVSVEIHADDHYTARTHALCVQGPVWATARIRRASALFPGRWHDLNED
jgi:hypothetical protein